MIPFDFEYYKPETTKEALGLFQALKCENKKPVYYGGGTEFISMARANNVYADAVIDIKGIFDCNVQNEANGELIIGSAVTLTAIAEKNLFPLLSLTVQRIADHTIQDKITLGGNLAGTIIYREALLPLLVADSELVIAGPKGMRRVPLSQVFQKRIQLEEGELILQVIIKESFLSLPYAHVKRTKNDKIDYPLITLAALKSANGIKIAFSGICENPFRSASIEQYLNNTQISANEKVKNILSNLPERVLSDINGSAEYRRFMFEKILLEVLEKFEGVV